MHIIVCIKQAPDTEARIKVKDGAPGVVRDNLKFVISPYDEFALEEALRLKEKHGGTVTALSLGPERVKEALRTALAVGADKAVHVNDAVLAGLDSRGVALALARAIQKMEHDLVLFGKKAVGVDRGQVPAQVAQMLGLPFVSQVLEVVLSEDAKTAKVEREIEGGRERFEVDLPAVLSREKSAKELRHAALKGIMMAKSKPIQAFTAADLGLDAAAVAPRLRVSRTEHPPERTPGRIVGGEAAQAVRDLVGLLREEAKVI